MIHGTSLDRRFPEDQREIVATTQARLINEMVALFPLIRENAEGKSTLRQPNPGDPVNIMISYNWDTSQDRAIMLANALKEKAAQSPAEIGNVWIDVDNMDDKLYHSMASALETSDLVLVMPSKLYEASCNCNLEIQYSRDLKKEIMHCKVERGYHPRGVVGLILGGSRYFDFCSSEPTEFQKAFDDMYQQILKFRKSGGASPATPVVPTVSPATAPAQVPVAPPAAAASPVAAAVGAFVPDTLKKLLVHLELDEYLETLEDQGVQSIADLKLWTAEELESIGLKKGHAKRLCSTAAAL
eukprot:m.112498 g.112498  ORF g.112498 m.112498 type:complete len:299 (-) comp9397_c0_seq2:23-919(-)